jgi:hypothetical protein
MSTHIIYVPGLGDGYDPFRRFCLRWWHLWGVSVEHVPITWYDGGNFEEKCELVRQAIGRSTADATVLIGESAGATLALHGAKEARVSKVITLCGVSSPTTPISPHLRRKAPALDVAVNTLPKSFNTEIHSVRAYMDNVVGKRYSVVAGAKEHVIWTVGHLMTIALCLTVLAPIITSIAKNQKK